MKNSGIERINTKKHIIITAALLVVAVGAVVAVLNKDKLLASKNETAETTTVASETAETTDGYTGADFEFETYETDETVGEDYVDDFDQAAYDSDYYATVVTPADIEDQSIKDLATYYSGYELYDLKAKIELEDKYEEYICPTLEKYLRPTGDVQGFCCFSNSPDIFWMRLVFKADEASLKSYMDGLVSGDFLYEGDGNAEGCFAEETTSDGKIGYSWTSASVGGTSYHKYEITFDPAAQVVNLYVEFGGGVG